MISNDVKDVSHDPGAHPVVQLVVHHITEQ